MAGRISLLILVTGLFASAWSTDRPPASANVQQLPQPSYRVGTVRETALHRWPVSRLEPTVGQSSDWAPTLAVSTPTDAMPKPLEPWDFLMKEPFQTALTSVLTKNWLELGQLVRQQHAEFIVQQQKLALWRRMISPKNAAVTR